MDNFQIHIVKKNLYGNESHWIGLYGSFFFRVVWCFVALKFVKNKH